MGLPRRGGAVPVLLALAALSLVLRALGLGAQPLTGDDVSVGQTARNFVGAGWPEPTMWNHPRLRDLLVALSLDALGDGAWGHKLWSVLLGALSAPATALLALATFAARRGTSPRPAAPAALPGDGRGMSAPLLEAPAGDEHPPYPAAVLAGLLVATDPLHLHFSRQAINDVYLSFFPVAAVVALLRYRVGRRPAWLFLAGLLLGLGCASKWSAAFPVAAAAAVVLVEAVRAAGSWRDRAAETALFGASLLLLPLTVYLVTWWPWLGRGHDLGELLRFHGAMAHETATHQGYAGTKLPGFPGEVVGAWRWFVQPIWYVDYIPPMPGRTEIPAGGLFLSGVASPLAWLATLPAAAWAGWRLVRARDPVAGWLLLLFLSTYLPFVLVPRPIWSNSALGVAPFALALVGWAAARLHERLAWPVRIWAGAGLLTAAFLWPAAAGLSTPPTDALLRALVAPAAFDPATH